MEEQIASNDKVSGSSPDTATIKIDANRLVHINSFGSVYGYDMILGNKILCCTKLTGALKGHGIVLTKAVDWVLVEDPDYNTQLLLIPLTKDNTW